MPIVSERPPSVKGISLDRDENSPRPNTPEEVNAILACQSLLYWLDELSNTHDAAHPDGTCWCHLCQTSQGLRWAVEVGKSLLESDMMPVTENEDDYFVVPVSH